MSRFLFLLVSSMTLMNDRWFMDLYEREADAVFRFALVRVRDREAAIEIVQDTFMKTWDYVRKGETVTEPRGFVFKVARNSVLDYLKKSKPLYERDLGEKAEAVFEIPISGGVEVDAELRGVLECMRGLSDDDHELVIMRYTEGIPVQDLARERRAAPNTITKRLARALDQVRECVGVVKTV